MDINAPSQLTELNTTATERLQRYINNYDANVINNWRFTAGQRFQDEIEKYEQVKQGITMPLEMGAALPEFTNLLKKGGRKIDSAIEEIKDLRNNPKTLIELLENKIHPETRETFSELPDRIQNLTSDIKSGISSVKNLAQQKISNLKNNIEPPKYQSMSQTRRELLPEEQLEHPLQKSAGFSEDIGFHQDEASTSRKVPDEKNYEKQLQDAEEEEDEIKTLNKTEGVSSEAQSPVEAAGEAAEAEAEGGLEAAGRTAGKVAGEAAAEAAAETGLFEGALGTAAETLGPVGIAAALGIGLYNLFDHGLHTPHPTNLKEMPSPALPKDINYNSTIRPHVNSVRDYAGGMTNF